MIRIVWITKANVTSPLPNDPIASTLQGSDHLTPRHYRQSGVHTATATLLIRVLGILGMG
jgi:hypothetical protein